MKTPALLFACLTVWFAQSAAAAPSPNVLLIVTDDQGYGDFSSHGNSHLQTPHIDDLAQAGVRFDRFFVNSFCAPTRAALLTGRWPLRTGCHGVTHNREAMRPSEVTIAEALQGAGYRTACIGKWHNGEQYPFTPQGQGFDQSFGFNNGHWNNYFNATLLRGAKPEATEGYISDVLTEEAMKFIAARENKPFFCYLAYNAPHSPYQVPDKYFDKFKAKGFDDTVSAFYGMCENLDDNVGRLLKHLETQQLADNTIVLFLTDNGGTAGIKIYNAGMRGGKTSVHEGGSRVPLFVRWPAANWQPHLVKPITSHIDLYPTLLDLCGVTAPAGPPVDGISLRPLLEAQAAAWPERVLFTHNPIDEANRIPGAVRTQQHRLVREIKGPAGGSRAKANDDSTTTWQLYDMEADPGQKTDIAAENPELVRRLSQLYDAWFTDISRDGLQRFPLPVGHAEQNPVELHAPQAFFDKPLHFENGPGFANDWLTGWTDARAKVWFDVEVVTAGEYDIELAVSCSVADAGSKLRVTVANKSLETTIPAASAAEVPLPHRDEKGGSRYRNREWATLDLGTIKLPQGHAKLTLEPLLMPGTQVMDVKHVKLFIRDSVADRSANRTLDRRAIHDTPFFLNLWCYGVHGPWGHKEEYTKYFATKKDPSGRQGNPIMASMLKSVDECFGRILDELAAQGIADNTIVIFYSDNGGNVHSNVPGSAKTAAAENNKSELLTDWRKWAGDQPPTMNTPLRDGKGTLYEGGTRVPLMWAWANRIQPGSTSEAVVGPIDLYPTLIDLLGIAKPAQQAFDGVSYAKVLKGDGDLSRTAFFNYHPHAGANRAGGVWVRSGDFKLLRWFGNPDTFELYNLRDDLSEANDLATKQPGKVKELNTLIARFLEDTGATYPRPNPAFQPSPTKPAADPLGAWKQRGCTATIANGILIVRGTGKPGAAFLGHAVGRMTGPASVRLRVRSAAGGQGKIDCLPNGAADESQILSTPLEIKSGDWQEITVDIKHPDRLGVLRLYLPATESPVEIDQIDIQGATGRGENWAF